MKRKLFSLLVLTTVILAGAVPVFAHGGEEGGFDAVLSIKQSIVALDQRQPNTGVIMQKLEEVLEKKDEVTGVDISKVEEAMALTNEMNFEEATKALFEAIGEDPVGTEESIGNPLQEYKKEYEGSTENYLLITASVLFILVGGLILTKS
ncbi:hypothetical protein L1765_12160 [Microaerobacter geothermalis]|uniref:hypothetical protein n=1 Tax=Microaerobacter geothermalis TaxID=674972 RepID=UPI001F1CAFFA|nr:hypothetical protein [Microaerobacter geothermalis]MCF6094715.1 hypothetical protein [Microaerobacter geothermalis]